ncbi:hypothetical protein NY78_1436 [Desulfovibrio sp. TomC]|nr:hypothetical protein NY78_1436 [Desulfovibrio sp. TomC]
MVGIPLDTPQPASGLPSVRPLKSGVTLVNHGLVKEKAGQVESLSRPGSVRTRRQSRPDPKKNAARPGLAARFVGRTAPLPTGRG